MCERDRRCLQLSVGSMGHVIDVLPQRNGGGKRGEEQEECASPPTAVTPKRSRLKVRCTGVAFAQSFVRMDNI